MKKFVGSLLVLLTVFTLGACGSKGNDAKGEVDQLQRIKDSGKLVLGTSPDFPPYEFYILNDEGKKEIAGTDISLAQAIADEIGVKLEIKASDFDGVLANIQSGTIDLGISGFSYTKKREQVMDFSIGYLQENSEGFQGVLMKKSEAEKYATLDDLKAAKLKLGAQKGSIQYETAATLTDANKIQQFGTIDAAILALNAGDILGVTVSESSIKPLLVTFPDLMLLPKDGFDLDPEGAYSKNVVGIPKKEGNDALIEVINKVIQENTDNGTAEKWKEEATELAYKAVDVE